MLFAYILKHHLGSPWVWCDLFQKKTGALKMGSSLNPEPNPLGSVRPLRSPLRFASVLENVLAQAGATNIAGWEIHHE